MLTIRKQHPAFGWGTFDWEDTGNNAIAAYRRTTEEETLLIFNNLSDQTISLRLPEDFWGAEDVLTGQQFAEAHIQLEPYRFIWLRQLS
jgi:maltose alpha-D-glucosyltransferase/alpha-amylase